VICRHIHITSQTFTVSNLPGGFTSGSIRSCITCVIRTDKALLNRPTSHDRNIRHIFFEPKVLCSCRRSSITQCSMRNQCSGLFICIMNYLHVLRMLLIVLSCVLCMTLMVYIYVYYRLFICTNLVQLMSLFFMVFHSIYQISAKIGRFLAKTVWNSPHRFISKTGRFIAETGRISVFLVFTVPPSSPVRFDQIFLIFIDFYRIFQKPTAAVTSDFPCSADFSTLLVTRPEIGRGDRRSERQNEIQRARLVLAGKRNNIRPTQPNTKPKIEAGRANPLRDEARNEASLAREPGG
jgi:hypothetical protein